MFVACVDVVRSRPGRSGNINVNVGWKRGCMFHVHVRMHYIAMHCNAPSLVPPIIAATTRKWPTRKHNCGSAQRTHNLGYLLPTCCCCCCWRRVRVTCCGHRVRVRACVRPTIARNRRHTIECNWNGLPACLPFKAYGYTTTAEIKIDIILTGPRDVCFILCVSDRNSSALITIAFTSE